MSRLSFRFLPILSLAFAVGGSSLGAAQPQDDDVTMTNLSPPSGIMPVQLPKQFPTSYLEATLSYNFVSSAYGDLIVEAKSNVAPQSGLIPPKSLQSPAKIQQGKGKLTIKLCIVCTVQTVPSGSIVELQYSILGPNGKTVQKTMPVNFTYFCGPTDLYTLGGLHIGGLGIAGAGAKMVPWGGQISLNEWDTPLPPTGGKCAFNVSYVVRNHFLPTHVPFTNRFKLDGQGVGANGNLFIPGGGAQKTLTNQIFLPPGSHELALFLDDDGLIPEKDEPNNQVEIKYSLMGDCTKPVKPPPPPSPTPTKSPYSRARTG